MAIIKLFADDTNFFISRENFELLRQLVICELQSFKKWIHANKLTVNYDPQKSSIVYLNLNRNHFLVLTIKGYLLGDIRCVTMNLPNIFD